MSPQTRLKLGVALLVLGLIMPAGTLAVAATDWPIAVKTVLSSILSAMGSRYCPSRVC